MNYIFFLPADRNLPAMDEMYIDTGYIMEIPGYLRGDLFILFDFLFRNGIHEGPGKHF